MDILDILGTVISLSQYEENQSDELRVLNRQLQIIDEFLKKIDNKVLSHILQDYGKDLLSQIETTKELIDEAKQSSKSNLIFQKLKALLPNSILNKLKEQNEKLKTDFDQFKQLYQIQCQQSSSNNLPDSRPNDIPQTLLDPENAVTGTIIDPDAENDDNQLKLIFKMNGREEVKHLFQSKAINLEEEVTVDFLDGDNANNQKEFGRNMYLSLMKDLDLVKMISGKHVIIHVERELIQQENGHQEEEEEKPEEDNNGLKTITLQVPQQKEEVFATVQEDGDYHSQQQSQIAQYKYTYYLENQGGNGTWVYLQNSFGAIKGKKWQKLGKKGQKIQIQSGDQFGVINNKENPSDVIIGYTFQVENEQ